MNDECFIFFFVLTLQRYGKGCATGLQSVVSGQKKHVNAEKMPQNEKNSNL